MPRLDSNPHRTTPSFEAARRWRPWRELPGALVLAASVALWIIVFNEVAAPLGDALVRLDASATTEAVDFSWSEEGALAAGSRP